MLIFMILILISLEQVQTILPLLKRGVGIHHGGLLPILKEIIEILFQVRFFFTILTYLRLEEMGNVHRTWEMIHRKYND